MSKEIKDRLTVVDKVYHQPFGKKAVLTQSKFTRGLDSKHQLYVRYLEATEEWQRLDTGWLGDDVGHLVIQNDEEVNRQVNPTDAEQEAVAKRVIQLSYLGKSQLHWLIPPGESMRGMPLSPQSLYYRCQHGTAEFTLTLVPK